MKKAFYMVIVMVVIAACAPQQQNSAPVEAEARDPARVAAVEARWAEYCAAGYCEGYSGRITEIRDDHIVVNINGNTRYLRYQLSGEPGSYRVFMQQTGRGGRDKP